MADKRQTAAELMAELQADPAFQAREAAAAQKRQAREQERTRLYAPLLSALDEIGIHGPSLQEVVQRFAPLPNRAVEILLAGLVDLDDPRAKETVIRALGAAKQPFDGRSLVDCYARTDDEGLKFAILNTIALARPHSIDEWLSAMEHTSAGETLRNLAID